MSKEPAMTDYFFDSRDEFARLQLQARVWEPSAEAMLDQIGIAPGSSCADLGCGAMGILGPLARRAGPSGRVVGIDRDETHLTAARAYVEQEGLTNVELQQQDVTATGLPRGAFDLVHTRFVFPHVASPPALFGEMMALAKPGAVIAIEEPDQRSWNFYPPCPHWPRLIRLVEDTFALRSDINFGRQTFAMLRQAGLTGVQVRAAVVALQNRHPYMGMITIGARAMRDRMIEAGLTTDAELETLLSAVEDCANDPERIQITFTVIQVWGRKPLS